MQCKQGDALLVPHPERLRRRRLPPRDVPPFEAVHAL